MARTGAVIERAVHRLVGQGRVVGVDRVRVVVHHDVSDLPTAAAAVNQRDRLGGDRGARHAADDQAHLVGPGSTPRPHAPHANGARPTGRGGRVR